MQPPIDIVKRKIKSQLNKHGTRGGMFGGKMCFIKDEDAFVNELAAVLLRRIADCAKDTDLTSFIYALLMKYGNMQSKQDLAMRIAGEIEKQT